MASPDRQPSRRRRVPAMAPEDRRAALIDATVPLLHQHGLNLSTRQIACAAGVAEGTIFGVFPDKASLVQAALLRALDPTPTVEALAAIDPRTDLRERLRAAVGTLTDQFAAKAHLMTAARGLVAADTGDELHRGFLAARERVTAALTDVIAPDAHRLRRSPTTVARLLGLLVGAASHGVFGDAEQLTADEIVQLLLDGLLIPPTDDTTPDEDRGGPVPC